MITSGQPLLPSLLEFALAYLVVLALPGTNFLIVAQASATASRRGALAAALGIGCGAGFLAAIALSGATLISGDPRMVTAAKLMLAAILVMIGLGALRRAWRADAVSRAGRDAGCGGYFCIGLFTAATNPVTSAFFVGTYVHASLGEDGGGRWLAVAAVFLIATTWFGTVALAFSHGGIRNAYQKARRGVDFGIGTLLAGMGMITAARLLFA